MPGEAERLEPDDRAGGIVASTLLNRVPSTVTKPGINVCFAVLAVQHDHPSVSTSALCLLLLASLYPTFLHCPKQWSPGLLWNQALVHIMTRFGQSPQAQSCSYPEVAMVAPPRAHVGSESLWTVHPLQKSMPLLPCLSLLSAWPWVLEQLLPYGLGK